MTSAKLPSPLILVIVSCFGRALWGLASVVPLMGYIISGRLSSPWFVYVLAMESILWVVIGIGLWRLMPPARIAAVALAAIAVVLGGRGLVLMMMSRVSSPTSYAMVAGFLLVDSFVIWFLSQASVKSLFASTSAAPVPSKL